MEALREFIKGFAQFSARMTTPYEKVRNRQLGPGKRIGELKGRIWAGKTPWSMKEHALRRQPSRRLHDNILSAHESDRHNSSAQTVCADTGHNLHSDLHLRPLPSHPFQTRNQYSLQRADRGVLADLADPSIIGKAIIADVLTQGEIILQFSNERTLKASSKDFETRIGAMVRVEQITSSKEMAEELASYRNSPDSRFRDIGLNRDNIDRLQNGVSAAVCCALKTALEALSSAQSSRVKLDETNQKLGYLNEETVRQGLNAEMGLVRAKAFRFDTLRDIVDWVGDQIKANKQEKAKPLRTIVRLCVGEFDGYPEPKETVDWETVFDPIIC